MKKWTVFSLAILAALALGTGCASSGSAGPESRPAAAQTDSPALRYSIADVHLHLVDFLQRGEGIAAAVAALDEAGVSRATIQGMPLVKKWDAADPRRPLYYLENDSPAYWYSATDVLVAREVMSLPPAERKRFHPLICGFNGTDMNAVDHVRRMLDWYPDLWHGIGEVMGRHDDLTALTYGETSRANHPALSAVYKLAAERDLPVLVHQNIGSVWLREPIYMHEMEEAVASHPETRFIWAHCGISRRIEIPTLTQELDRMLGRYENLWADLSWVVFETYIAPDGEPAPEWIELIERHPDRFIIGSDVVGKFDQLPREITKYYVLLDRLKPQTAEKVARGNFLDILPKAVREGLED